MKIDWFEPESEHLSWFGIAELEAVDAGADRVPWRLPRGGMDVLAEQLSRTAQAPTGVRIAFETDAGEIRARLSNDERFPINLVCRERIVTRSVGQSPSEVTFGRDPQHGRVELWLPHRNRTVFSGIGIPSGATIRAVAAPPVRWLAYGSSITASGGADAPALTWSAQIARSWGCDLVNLGLTSQAYLDLAVARHIAASRADIITVGAGINIYVTASMSVRVYRSALFEFLRVVHQGHPDVPIAVVSPIASPSRETVPNFPRTAPRWLRNRAAKVPRIVAAHALIGPTLNALREATAEVTAHLIDGGDQRMLYVDGRQLLDRSNRRQLADGLHPSQGGEDLIAARYGQTVIEPLLKIGAVQTTSNPSACDTSVDDQRLKGSTCVSPPAP